MKGISHFTVNQDDDGQRLDRWIKKNIPEISYVLAQKLIRKGQVRIDGKRVKPDSRLVSGQNIRVAVPDIAKDNARDNSSGNSRNNSLAKKRELSQADADFIRSLVIYDDGDVIAINKPCGLAVQGGTNTKRHIDGMLEALKNKSGVTPRLVHRLDKDTSGVLLLARSAEVARRLGKSFKGRDIKKIYWALVSPSPEIEQGTIRVPIAKSAKGGLAREKMVVDEKEGKKAVTEFCVLEKVGDEVAFVSFWPRTGRTHQIRVHAQAIGSSILGDGKYKCQTENDTDNNDEGYDIDRNGDKLQENEKHRYFLLENNDALAKRLHLHARRIILKHPLSGRWLDITAPLPSDLRKSWNFFGFDINNSDDPFININ